MLIERSSTLHDVFVVIIDLLAAPSPVMEAATVIFQFIVHMLTHAVDSVMFLYDLPLDFVSPILAGQHMWLEALRDFDDGCAKVHVILVHDDAEEYGPAAAFLKREVFPRLPASYWWTSIGVSTTRAHDASRAVHADFPATYAQSIHSRLTAHTCRTSPRSSPVQA